MLRRILVVDDEPDLVELVSYNLSQQGYEVFHESNGFDAIRVASQHVPDLIVLDVMMPEIPGTEVARRLRANPTTAGIPILMLTARASEGDQLAGLSVGADDYVVKPFSMRVLLARVEALLRRAPKQATAQRLAVGGVLLDLGTHEVLVDGEAQSFTPTEFRLLAALLNASGRVLDRDELIEKGMGPGVAVTDRAIDVHIAAVRRKLGKHSAMVQTVRGVGYRIVKDAAADPAGKA